MFTCSSSTFNHLTTLSLPSCFLNTHLKKNQHIFEIIIDSHKSCKISYTHHTTLPQTRKMIGVIQLTLEFSQISQFLHFLKTMPFGWFYDPSPCVCIDPYNHHHNQGTEVLCHCRGTLSCCSHKVTPCPLFLSLWNHLSVLCFYVCLSQSVL